MWNIFNNKNRWKYNEKYFVNKWLFWIIPFRKYNFYWFEEIKKDLNWEVDKK